MRQLRIGVAVACAACGLAAVRPAQASTVPRWVRAADHRTLDRAFGGARPTETHYISYPKKIAVIFEFSRVVICGACSAPSNAGLPRGRVIRFSYDRRTHRITGAYRFCEARGTRPARALCLRR